MFDNHVILTNESNITNLCAQAKQAGLSGICFTEHIVSSFEKAINLKINNNCNIPVFHGAKIDFEYDTHEVLSMKTAGYGFDYIVNDVNTLNGINLEDLSLYANYIRNDVYEAYLEKVFDSLEASYDYSVISAPGYVSLNSYYPFPILTFRDFPELFDTILMRLIYSGKGIEINASAYSKISHPIPDESVISRYRELGGEIITVGSFASPGTNIKRAYDMLESLGFKYITVFKKGSAEMVKI